MDYSNDSNNKKVKKNKSKKKKIENKVGTIIFRVLLAVVLIGGFATAGATIGAYLGIIEQVPHIEAVAIKPNIYTTIIYDKDGNEIDRLKGEENREYVAFDKIPQNLKNAFVAIEDERFYQHNGIDLKGMVRALYTNLTTKTDRREGASTITQQLIKNVRKVKRNDIKSKLQEQYLAVQYEKDLTEAYGGDKKAAKDFILGNYMNTIGLHHNLNGVQTAADYYFDADVSELSLSECAIIAAITQNPSLYTPATRPADNKIRATWVLNKMLELEMITEAEHDEALADLNDAETGAYSRVTAQTKEKTSFHSYFVDALIKELSEDLQEANNWPPEQATDYIYNAGLKIYTTQDMDMQRIMDTAFLNDELFSSSEYEIDVEYYLTVKNRVTGKITNHPAQKKTVKTMEEADAFALSAKNELMGPNDEVVPGGERTIPIPQPQAAMIIIDYHTGQIKALSGGRGDKLLNRGYNRATESERHPGSVFKVLASYAPAIDMGRITPATVIVDEPYTVKEFKYTPTNWWGSAFRGPKTVRVGIRDSMNVLAVKNLMDTGIDNAWDYLQNFGFTTLIDSKVVNGQVKSDKVPSLALGGLTYGVTQKQVTAAYGTIANLGVYNKPIFYTKILNQENKTVIENKGETRQVLKRASAYVLTDMMKDVLSPAGTGNKAKFTTIKMPIAGKTGTASKTTDLTFVGYTPYYVAGVWLGFDIPKQMRDDSSYHLKLWKTVMEEIHKDLPTKEFERPDGVVSASVCSKSGKLAIANLCGADGSIITDIFVVGTQPTEYCNYHTVGMLAATEEPEETESVPPSDYWSPESFNDDFTITPPPLTGGATFGTPPPAATPRPTEPPVIPDFTQDIIQFTKIPEEAPVMPETNQHQGSMIDEPTSLDNYIYTP